MRVEWTPETRKALAQGGWVDLHTELITVVLYLAGEEPLITTVEARQLPTWDDPWFALGSVSFPAARKERVALGFSVSNDRGEELYIGGLDEVIEPNLELLLDGISAGVQF